MRAAVAALAVASALVFATVTARADEPSAVELNEHELGDARADIDATMAQMRAVSVRVRDQLRTTRKRGTKAQIVCVDRALSRSDVALRRAREASNEVLGAYARGEVEGARAGRRRLAEIRHTQTLAANEGASCAPPPLQIAKSGSTTVKLEIDPKIAPAPP